MGLKMSTAWFNDIGDVEVSAVAYSDATRFAIRPAEESSRSFSASYRGQVGAGGIEFINYLVFAFAALAAIDGKDITRGRVCCDGCHVAERFARGSGDFPHEDAGGGELVDDVTAFFSTELTVAGVDDKDVAA